MGRPSLKDERKEEILAAYEVCVARFGVEGATLERVADEAGLARPLIRHNVGNRDELMQALIDRFFDQSAERVRSMVQTLPTRKPAEALVEALFSAPIRDHTSVLVAEALIAASATRPQLAEQMQQWLVDFIDAIAAVLNRQYPMAAAKDKRAAAAGVTGIYFNVESMIMLGEMQGVRSDSRQAALMLIAALDR
ncbi:MAG: TetR/AcrR family transcriptional regulator [Pseudomonadota bacterium]